jgi:hypothetical protein
MIEDIKAGRPAPRYVYPPHAWKEIPKDPVLNMLWLQIAKNMDELIETLTWHGVRVEPEEVIKIVKEEWKKGAEMDSWLKFTPKEYLKEILGVDPEDP